MESMHEEVKLKNYMNNISDNVNAHFNVIQL